MKDSIALTEGPITKNLIRLTLPIVATNFIQTAYGLVDMIWIGKLGSEAVIAVGTAGFIINMAFALFAIVVTGTGIRISNFYGSGHYETMKSYAVNGVGLALLTAGLYSIITFLLRGNIIAFFKLEPSLQPQTENYLTISLIGIPIMFLNSIFSSFLTNTGNSRTPFKLNSIGFIINIFLDPLLILGVGSFSGMGIQGAALATLLSRLVVLVLFIIHGQGYFVKGRVVIKFHIKQALDVFLLGAPFALQRILFTFIGIMMARLISQWGSEGIAVQKIGLQIEAISYMTIGGLYGAVIAFMGQNHGAGNSLRIKQGYHSALLISFSVGFITTIVFLLFPSQIFSFFLNQPDLIDMGSNYLRIIGLSQIFMCIEIVTMASFNGLGKTHIPAMVSVIFTMMRIPLVLFLAKYSTLGLNSIWVAISLTSILKGVLLVILFQVYLKKENIMHLNGKVKNAQA